MRCLSDRKAKSSSQNHSCLRSAVASRWEKASNATRAGPLVSITKTRSTGLGLIVSDSLPGRDLSWSHSEIGNSYSQTASLRSHLVRSALGSGADLAAPFTHVRFTPNRHQAFRLQCLAFSASYEMRGKLDSGKNWMGAHHHRCPERSGGSVSCHAAPQLLDQFQPRSAV